MPERKRPGQLLAIAVIAISLGSLGGCMGLWGVVGAVFTGTLQNKQMELMEQSGAPSDQVAQQRAMVERMQAVSDRWVPFTATHQTLNFVASLLLLAAGVMLLRWSARGPGLFVIAVASNSVVDLAGAILGVLVQRETSAVMNDMMRDLGAAQPGAGAPEMGRMMEGIMQASTWVGLCFGAGWLLLKLGYYAWGVVYLRKPDVRREFQQPPPHEYAGPPAGTGGPPPGGYPPAA